MTRYTYRKPPFKTVSEDDEVVLNPSGSLVGFVNSTYIDLEGPYPFEGVRDAEKVKFAQKLFGYGDTLYLYQLCPEYRYEDFRAATRLIWGILSLSQPEKYLKLEVLIKPPKVEKYLTLLKEAPWITSEKQRRAMIPIISRYVGVDLAPLMKEEKK